MLFSWFNGSKKAQSSINNGNATDNLLKTATNTSVWPVAKIDKPILSNHAAIKAATEDHLSEPKGIVWLNNKCL